MHFFYLQPPIEHQPNGKVLLNKEESFHAIRVMRIKIGKAFHLVDGLGTIYKAIYAGEVKGQCEMEITETIHNYQPISRPIHIAIAPAKNAARNEWFLEKATEIGISEISFIQCEHSERSVINLERCQKILIAAIKQSERAYLPHLHDLLPFKKWVSQSFHATKLIGHCGPEVLPITQVIKNNNIPGNSINKSDGYLMAIGPEGGFSSDEINLAQQHQFSPVSLGPSKLRTETAALTACVALNLLP